MNASWPRSCVTWSRAAWASWAWNPSATSSSAFSSKSRAEICNEPELGPCVHAPLWVASATQLARGGQAQHPLRTAARGSESGLDARAEASGPLATNADHPGGGHQHDDLADL